jgi:uncharacterized membrane protein YeiB
MNTINLNERIDTLDYLRGFALMGIILVNIGPLLLVNPPVSDSLDASYWRFLYLFVEGRFYTIFTFLFGVGFYMFITRAKARGKNGYVLFLRRLLVLFLFGLIHVKFHPGEALTVYAISGLILLPFYRVKKIVNLVVGLAMLVVLSIFAAKIFMVIPLMLVGIATGQYQVFERISQHLKKVAIFTIMAFVLSVLMLIYQYHYAPFVFGTISDSSYIETQRFISIGITIGPAVSAFYVGLIILVLQYPFIRQLLSPLKSYGRMAFTNYLSQTALIFLAGKVLHLYNHLTYTQSLLVCLAIYVIQLFFSKIWLRFFKFGPLEWIWRALTYLQLPEMRKRS